MTREQAIKYLPIVQALAEEKPIQEKYGDTWIDVKSVILDGRELRVRPAGPREYWINLYEKPSYSYAYPTKEEADRAADRKRTECLHVMEAYCYRYGSREYWVVNCANKGPYLFDRLDSAERYLKECYNGEIIHVREL